MDDMTHNSPADQSRVLARIAAALERLAPPAAVAPDFEDCEAFVWNAHTESFEGVAHVSRVPLALLEGIERAGEQLVTNTDRFARGLPANNALLWGARGMGKSSLVKAAHAEVRCRLHGSDAFKRDGCDLKLVELHREDIATLPRALGFMRGSKHRFIVFCDDLSFDHDDTSYKSLKAVLEGGIEGRPGNVIFYATSNRRHLMPRDMADNERASAINPGEAVEEKVSLSDRFGLWLGFYGCSQDQYLAMVFAQRLAIERSTNPARIDLAWRLATGRAPTAKEKLLASQYLSEKPGDPFRWKELALDLYNLNAFLYVN